MDLNLSILANLAFNAKAVKNGILVIGRACAGPTFLFCSISHVFDARRV